MIAFSLTWCPALFYLTGHVFSSFEVSSQLFLISFATFQVYVHSRELISAIGMPLNQIDSYIGNELQVLPLVQKLAPWVTTPTALLMVSAF